MCMIRIAMLSAPVLALSLCAYGQDAPPPPAPGAASPEIIAPATGASATAHPTDQAAPLIPLRVPKGLPLQVALDQEVRVQKEGQAIHGRILQPVYAFDRIVIPVGTEARGRVVKIEDLSGKQRTLSALDADFTPNRKLDLEFTELVLSDGKHIPVHTVVSPGSGRTIEFVHAKGEEEKQGVKSAASEQIDQAKQQAKQTWEEAMKQVKEPGRMHRLEHYLIAQLPAHPQYLEAGTLYAAELQDSLEFGTTPLTPELAASLSKPIPAGSLVHATLMTALDSATSKRDDPVEAILWQPVFDGENLIVPAGTWLKGSVIQVHAAYKMHHNGQLRLAFHELQTPDGLDQKVSAVLVGVAAAKAEHLELDSEGGAQATSANTRYLSTAISVGLAAISSQTDSDAHYGGGAGGESSGRAAGGAGGFKLIGLTLGLMIHSQPFGMAMGAAGAGRSIYDNFLGPGHEVVFPRDTPMEISLSSDHPAPGVKSSASTQRQ